MSLNFRKDVEDNPLEYRISSYIFFHSKCICKKKRNHPPYQNAPAATEVPHWPHASWPVVSRWAEIHNVSGEWCFYMVLQLHIQQTSTQSALCVRWHFESMKCLPIWIPPNTSWLIKMKVYQPHYVKTLSTIKGKDLKINIVPENSNKWKTMVTPWHCGSRYNSCNQVN